MNRRTFLAMSAALPGIASVAQAQSPDFPIPDTGAEIIRLWPATPPGGENVSLTAKYEDFSRYSNIHPDRVARRIGTPFLQVFRPEKPNGTAMIVIPGGSYLGIWFDKEGFEIARHFNDAGITCFVLFYRLPAEGWANRADVPLQDCQRAMRLISANADKFGIDRGQLGVIGFSAGGHAAASLATRWDANVYAPVDESDALSTRPAFAALIYPVITMGAGGHSDSRSALLGPDASPEKAAAYSCEKLVTSETPPCFIAQAADDITVSYATNALAMAQALQDAGIISELHGFAHGGHGFALRNMNGQSWTLWPQLFLAWARENRFVSA